MWRLILYLDKYKDPNRGDHWRAQARPTIHAFVEYLVFKTHFMEDWRITLWEYFYRIIGKNLPQSKLGSKLSNKRWKKIEDVIKHCIDRERIQRSKPPYSATTMEITIWTDHKSREFLRPLRFLNACFAENEYGRITAFAFGVAGTGVVGLIFNWWSMDWLKNLIVNVLTNIYD